MSVKVRVKDFQSIREAEIEIDGLTAITGSNNTGKSALLRAIRGVFQNTRGTAFVRHGAAFCQVDLEFLDGTTVTWKKGPKIKPTYIINGGKPIHPGQGVPDEIKALGVRTVTAGGRDIWPQIASQLSGQVFLLDEPGSVLAEAVANVDRVGRLNRALKAAEKDRRAATSELKIRLSDRDKLEAELTTFNGLEKAVREVDAIEKLHHQTERVGRALRNVTVLRDRVVQARETVSKFEGIESVCVPAPGDVGALLDELEELKGLHRRFVNVRGRVARYDGVEAVDVEIETLPTEKLAIAMSNAGAMQAQIEHVKLKVKALEASAEKNRQGLREVEAEVAEILGDMGECPVCGSVVDCTHKGRR